MLEGLDKVLVDRAGPAQSGHGVAPQRRAAVDDGNVLQRLHRAQADFVTRVGPRAECPPDGRGSPSGQTAERAAISANSTTSAKVAGASVDEACVDTCATAFEDIGVALVGAWWMACWGVARWLRLLAW